MVVVATAIRNDPETWNEAILGYAISYTLSPHKPLSYILATLAIVSPNTYLTKLPSRPRNDYISTITSPNSWGGAIELSILSTHYQTEIASVDVETGRIDHFTPASGSPPANRALLVYSGIHYDAAVLAPQLGLPAEWCTSIVPIRGDNVESDETLEALTKLAGKLRKKRKFTNTATFDLKCEVSRPCCGHVLGFVSWVY